jgi:ABC-type dipeptide/oligopeptide/nickel transport system permease component
MTRYIARRLTEVVPTVLGIALLTFLIVRLLPGDPATFMAGDGISAEQLAAVRARLGLDQPLGTQLLDYLRGVLTFDFGNSLLTNVPVRDLLLRALPVTIAIATAAMVLGTLLAVPLGAIAAHHGSRGRKLLDQGLTWTAMVVDQMPSFWLGLIFMLVFVLQLGWLPATGPVPWDDPVTLVLRLLPAVLILAAGQVASIARITRAAVRDQLDEDYVRTARSLGQPGLSVLFRQVTRNGMLPVVTAMGLSFGRLLGGTVILETIFALPGLGTLLVNAINSRDYPIVQAVVFVYALTFVLINLATDLAYRSIDPRVRL